MMILEAAATSKTAHCRIVTVTGTVRIGYTAAVELPVYDTDCPKSFKLACTLEFKIAYRVTGTCQTDLPLKGQIFHREAENRLSRRPRDEKKLNFK